MGRFIWHIGDMEVNMKLTVLVENNTLIDKNYYGEPGLSFLIEEENLKVLFDLGYSDVLVRNAAKMQLDLNNINCIILSHGHLDHTWGLSGFMQAMNPERYMNPENAIKLIAHPQALQQKINDGEPIGLIYSEEMLKKCFKMSLSKEPIWLTPKLCYLGEIERTNDYENKNPIGITSIDGVEQDDYIIDDTALAYKTEKGIVIITGCSHSGICNIVEYAKKVCEDNRVIDIVGGFHLLNPSSKQLFSTLEYMRSLAPKEVHACHCTDLHSKIQLSQVVELKEMGVGIVLEYD